MATHPPLTKRILAIEPNWNGVFPQIESPISPPITGDAIPTKTPVVAAFAPPPAATIQPDAAGAQLVPVAQVHDAFNHIGDPEQSHRDFASDFLTTLDPLLVESAHEPYAARASYSRCCWTKTRTFVSDKPTV